MAGPAAALSLAGLALAAAPSAEVGWEEVERLEAAGEPEAALAGLPADDAALPPGEALRLARARHRLLHRLARYRDAQEAGLGWISHAEVAGDTAEQAAAHRETARSFSAVDQGREAQRHLRRALALLGSGGEPGPRADLSLDLAFSLLEVAEYAEAESLLRRVEEDWKGRPDPALGGRLWGTWATARQYQGDPLGALEYRERSVRLLEEAGEPARLSSGRYNLGLSLLAVHDYSRAIELFRRAREGAKDPRLRTLASISLGICHLELNQVGDAEEALDEGRRLAAEAGYRNLESWAVGELGLVAWEQGDGDRAMAQFDRAIAGFRQTRDARNEQAFWSNKGLVRRDQGRFTEALAFYREAERIERGIPGQLPSPNLRKHLGQCLAGLGRDREAEELLRRALALADEAGDSKVAWETQRELARLYRRTGRPAQAGEAYEAALAGIESIRGALRLPALKADFLRDKVEAYAEAVDFQLAQEGPEAVRKAFHLAERARARAFLDSLIEARAGVHEDLPPEILAAEQGLLAEISGLQARLRRDGPTPARAASLAARERDLEDLYLGVRLAFPRFHRLRHPEPAGLSAVQQALPPGAVLLAYFLAEPRSHLWIVSGEVVAHRSLPGTGAIEAAVRGLYARLLDPAAEPALAELGSLLLTGVPSEPAPSALLIVPSGPLHSLPFEALPLAGRTLAEVAPTTYLPSASALVDLAPPPAGRPPRLLALGGAEFKARASGDRAASFASLRRLGALPHSGAEARMVLSEFGAAGSTLLLGGAATESRLKAEDLGSYSVLHLATHGWIDPASAARSGLVLGAEEGGEDGLLQFREILRLPLRADLVTLSACQTALGELVAGEGMVGLSRAFFYAGAPSVVASLWNVDDEASARLMRHFYRGLGRGWSKQEALRRARLELRSDPRHRHPYYWAPFILVGRGDDGVEVPAPRRSLAGAALLAVAAAAAAWIGLRRRPRPGQVRSGAAPELDPGGLEEDPSLGVEGHHPPAIRSAWPQPSAERLGRGQG